MESGVRSDEEFQQLLEETDDLIRRGEGLRTMRRDSLMRERSKAVIRISQIDARLRRLDEILNSLRGPDDAPPSVSP